MLPEPTITPVSLDDLSSASCEFGTCSLPSQEDAECLVIAFSGVAENSGEHSGTFLYMEAMIAAGITAWRPAALVMDLTNLWYEWGDGMARVLGTIPLPTTVVTSSRNRKGLTSLVDAELFQRPSDWLFDTFPEALRACDRKLVAEREGPSADPPVI